MVICQICSKELKRVTRTHLLKHEITTEEYLKKFPGAEIIDQQLRYSYGKFFRDNNPMKLEKHKKLMSDLHTGREFSQEHRKNISKSKQGKSNGPRSEETKAKISLTNKETYKTKKQLGYVRPEYKMSPEAKERASNRMLGNTLGKIGHHNKGKVLNLTCEQRKNRSAKRVSYLSKNKNIKSGTKPELKCIEFLTNNNIKYEHQYPIHTDNGSWLYDFWLPEMNLLVEIDGEFWHSTKQAIVRDEIKNSVARNLNLPVVRISTDDLNFFAIFQSQEEIWQKNILIIEKRKKKYV
jgi:very-short-patch-repair endonuclease